jgi:ribosome-binding factor A
MSHRIDQINELIRVEFSRLVLSEIEFPLECLVTILRVETSPDLRHAKVWISVMPISYAGTVLEILRRHVGRLQLLLNKRLSMKPLPRLAFAIDDTEHRASSIDALLDRIKETE